MLIDSITKLEKYRFMYINYENHKVFDQSFESI